jgi:hypothetical protein
MTVKHIIRVWPKNRVAVCVEAVGMNDYPTLSNGRFGNKGLIRGSYEILSIEEESPGFAIRPDVPCNNTFSGKPS